MTESTCFVSIPRTNAESLARICALAAFSSNDAVAALDTVAESAVAGVLLLQPDKRRPPAASRVMPPVFRMLPPSGYRLANLQLASRGGNRVATRPRIYRRSRFV